MPVPGYKWKWGVEARPKGMDVGDLLSRLHPGPTWTLGSAKRAPASSHLCELILHLFGQKPSAKHPLSPLCAAPLLQSKQELGWGVFSWQSYTEQKCTYDLASAPFPNKLQNQHTQICLCDRPEKQLVHQSKRGTLGSAGPVFGGLRCVYKVRKWSMFEHAGG